MPSNNGGYAVPPPRRYADRFYNPPEIRRQQQQLLLQQQQLQMMQMHMLQQQQQQQQQQQKQQQQGRDDDAPRVVALSIPRPIIDPASSFKVRTNLDRFMESVTPFVAAQFLSKVNVRDGTTQEANILPFFRLEDLWESFKEWSAYGAGVPLLLDGKDPVVQYYVPFLSGIQLYVDPTELSSPVRGLNEEIDAESYTDVDGKAKTVMKLNTQRLNILSRDDKSVIHPYNCGSYSANSPGRLLFQFFEQELPYNRRPLADKISVLKSQYPELTRCRSCDLLPSSWICVAWYPIYRIPAGSTLGASFLTFHSLSTQFRSKTSPKFHAANTRKVRGIVDPTAKISLPVFALASYKLNGSIMSPRGPHEREQENSLLQAADKWLKHLQVTLFDYDFFRKHYCPPGR